ncbi:hypothetical protein ABKN59_011218 [Abortiporus biennis]
MLLTSIGIREYTYNLKYQSTITRESIDLAMKITNRSLGFSDDAHIVSAAIGAVVQPLRAVECSSIVPPATSHSLPHVNNPRR